jgi:hypothetical protein
MSFDLHTFLYNLLGAIVGFVVTIGWFLSSYAVAVYFDSWIYGVTMFLSPMVVLLIYRMGQKHDVT